MPDAPVQHTPKHLEGDGAFDPRHPAASAFAPLQPAAGVVADDVEERDQNLAKGQPAAAANRANKDQREKLAAQHAEALRAGATTEEPRTDVEGDKATPAKKK